MIDSFDLRTGRLSRIQGEIFEETVNEGFNSLEFIERFMNGKTAWHLDLPRHKTSWCGKGYIIDEFFRETDVPFGKTLNKNLMFWMGYIYRYWHYLTGQSSREIYGAAHPLKMQTLYPRLSGMPSREAVQVILSE